MAAYEIKFRDARELAEALKALGADMRSLPFFDNRREGLFILQMSMSGQPTSSSRKCFQGGEMQPSMPMQSTAG